MTTLNTIKTSAVHFAEKIIHHKIIIAAALLILTVSSALSCVFNNVFSSFAPVNYNSITPVDSLTASNKHYVNCTADKLYYTGYNYEKNGHVKGYYYYSLKNNLCTIYLLKAEDDITPEQTLENVSFTAKLITNDNTLNSLLKYMANDLNWNYYGIARYSSSTIISEYDYHKPLYIFSAIFTVLITLCDIVLIIHLCIIHRRKRIQHEKSYRYRLKHSKHLL